VGAALTASRTCCAAPVDVKFSHGPRRCYGLAVGLPLPQISSAGREVVALARHAVLMRHDISRPVIPHSARPGDDVVVCLHGAFATAGVLRPLRARLERHATVHTATMTYPLGPGVAALARRLSGLVETLPDGCALHLLGHSLGGVVARYWAQHHGGSQVAQTISLAAPFAGMPHVGRLPLPLGRDLAAGSPLLRDLALGAQRALAPPHLSIVAGADTVVRAPMSHALAGSAIAYVRGCGHNAMLYDERVAAIVEERVLDHCWPSRRAI